MSNLMNRLNLTPELLGISDVEIIKINKAPDGAIYITVSSTKTETRCRIIHLQNRTDIVVF